MSSMNSQKAIRVNKHDQERIKNKRPVESTWFIPKSWNRSKFVHNGCLYEQIGNRWYLMKEEFCERS